MFEEAGVPTKVEANGKIFPVSDKAAQVLDALVQRVERSGAVLRCSAAVLAIEPLQNERLAGARFTINVGEETIAARCVILAVGGTSYPGCGTTGDGYTIAHRFGHTIIEPRPALVPLRVGLEWVAGLKGLSVRDAIASVYSAHLSCRHGEKPCFSRTRGSAARRFSTSAAR